MSDREVSPKGAAGATAGFLAFMALSMILHNPYAGDRDNARPIKPANPAVAHTPLPGANVVRQALTDQAKLAAAGERFNVSARTAASIVVQQVVSSVRNGEGGAAVYGDNTAAVLPRHPGPPESLIRITPGNANQPAEVLVSSFATTGRGAPAMTIDLTMPTDRAKQFQTELNQGTLTSSAIQHLFDGDNVISASATVDGVGYTMSNDASNGLSYTCLGVNAHSTITHLNAANADTTVAVFESHLSALGRTLEADYADSH
ncbi:MAG TPA: hypothetical protein VLF69_00845 [Candidatus Saccharimonadales bacterium]|nr:hypothetical protein [Candidatus Saccharimonadales bacterium]